MAIVVVGGNARGVGKTSVIAGVISHLPEYTWTAMKITSHTYGFSPVRPKREPIARGTRPQIIEEHRRDSGTDTSRFLAAGAARAFLVCAPSGTLAQAMPAIRNELDKAENAIIESNSILEYLKPDIYLTILDPAAPDFKASAQHFLERADAVLIKATVRPVPHWRQIEGKPQFAIAPPDYMTDAVVDFVKTRLA
ncbi:MAG TPA: hypothetical protein VFA02_11635 [Pseudacidobacterium sp.]|nr:hypothetical protein [Pseudacidobacterium sp.]